MRNEPFGTLLLRLVPLLTLLLAATAAAQPVPDTLRAPADADSIAVFGWTVDADGDRVLVGARVWPPPTARSADATERADHHGTVFVYRLQPDGAWEVEGRLRADYISNEDCFSWALDLRGDVAAVGAECESSDGQHGAVYLYRYSGTGWVREAKLQPSSVGGEPAPACYFGESVSLGEDYLVVGTGCSPNPSDPDEDYGSGAAYVFEEQGGAWVHTSTLVNDDADVLINEYFGGAVAAARDVILIGAPGEDAPDVPNRGAAYIFEREGGAWRQQAKLVAPVPEQNGHFGEMLAAGEGVAAISAWGAVYPADEVQGGWQLGERLEGTYAYGPYGVARHGARLLMLDRLGAEVRGRLYVEDASGWSETILPVPEFEQHRDELVSLTGHHAFIGHPHGYPDDQRLSYVLVYDLPPLTSGEADAPNAPLLSLAVAPNPTRGAAAIRFDLAQPGTVRLVVYDVLGRQVATLVDGVLPGGSHSIRLDTSTLPAGLYPVRLEMKDQTVTSLVTVVR